MLGQQGRQEAALLVEPANERVQPRVTLGVGGNGSNDAERRPRLVACHRHVQEPIACSHVLADDLGASQSGGVEGLGRGHDRHGMIRRSVDVEVRDELGSREHERRVDLVGHHSRAVLGDDVADPFQLGPREDPAPRVVWLGEQQRASSVREESVEPIEVQLGPRRVRVDDQIDPLSSADLGDAEVGAVRRHGQHQRARIGQDVEGQPDAGRDVDHREHLLRVDVHAVAPLREPGVGGTELATDLEARVPRHAVRHGSAQCLGDRRREREVHLRHPGRDDVGVGGAPLLRKRTTGLVVGQVPNHADGPAGAGARSATTSRSRSTRRAASASGIGSVNRA